jgi:hypothetical protein
MARFDIREEAAVPANCWTSRPQTGLVRARRALIVTDPAAVGFNVAMHHQCAPAA